MSALELFNEAPDEIGTLQQVVPCEGWWVLVTWDPDGPKRRTHRVRVAAWGTFLGAAGVQVWPLVAGDRGGLAHPTEIYSQWDGWLWHDGDSACTCRSTYEDPEIVTDYTWCSSCIGIISESR